MSTKNIRYRWTICLREGLDLNSEPCKSLAALGNQPTFSTPTPKKKVLLGIASIFAAPWVKPPFVLCRDTQFKQVTVNGNIYLDYGFSFLRMAPDFIQSDSWHAIVQRMADYLFNFGATNDLRENDIASSTVRKFAAIFGIDTDPVEDLFENIDLTTSPTLPALIRFINGVLSEYCIVAVDVQERNDVHQDGLAVTKTTLTAYWPDASI